MVSPPKRPAVKNDLRFGFDVIKGRVRNIPIKKEPITFTKRVANGKNSSVGNLLIKIPVRARKMAPKKPPKPTHKRLVIILNLLLYNLA